MKFKFTNRPPCLFGKVLVHFFMKSIIFLFCSISFALSPLNGEAQNAEIIIDSDVTLNVKQVFRLINKQTDYKFIYRHDLLKTSPNIDLKKGVIKAGDLLDKTLSPLSFTYNFTDGSTIVVKKSPMNSSESNSVEAFDKKIQFQVSGTVTDKEGAPLPGASIVEKGTTNGAQSDFDGNYTMEVANENAVLIVSYIGYATKEIPLNGQSVLDIILEESAAGLEEVVVVGYGTQKKIDVTGSIVSAKGAEIVKSPSPNVASSLAGRLPGVIINNRNGEAGYDDPTIFIRGRSTTGNANPLIIIDGVEREGLSRINPYDIENITVLKDASAAIYGARAANGVILVTTKRGSLGKPSLELTYNQGFSNPSRNLKMADSYLFATVSNESRATQGFEPLYSESDLQKFRDGSDSEYPNTNWQDVMTKDFVLTQNANLSVSGGTENVKYLASLGYLNQPAQYNYGVGKYQQVNIRSNIDIQVTDNFKFGLNLAGRLEDRNRPYNDRFTIASNVMLNPPTTTIYWPGTDLLRPGRGGVSLVNMVSGNSGFTEEMDKVLNSTLSFRWDIPSVKKLWVDGSVNYDTRYNFNKRFYKPADVFYEVNGEYERTIVGATKSSLSEGFNQNSATTLYGKINYENSFSEHKLGAMFGYEQRQTNYDLLSASRSNFISSVLPELFAGSSAKNDQSNNGTSVKTARQNIFGRVTYDYGGKYLVQGLFRYDGSQNFAKGNRFGFFPGFSAGWRMSEETFMQRLSFVDNLKIRASYGELGNDQIPSYQYLSSYTYSNSNGYVINNTDVSGLIQNSVANPDLTWEVAKTWNLGVEGTLWDNMLGIELDIFKTRRSNILTKSSAVVPDYTGLALPDENVGIVENKGFELQLSHDNRKNNLKYGITGNFAFARNKVIFAEEEEGAEDYQLATGHPMGTSLYYNAIGIFRDQQQVDSTPSLVGAQPGDIIYEDRNGDNIVNSLDRIRIDENIVPEINFGLTLSLEYKNFDLTALLQGQENANIYHSWFGRVIPLDGFNFPERRVQDYWTADNINATMPRNEYGGGSRNLESSTQWLLDAGFLRLKNLEIGYNLPSSTIDALKVKEARFYINGFNLFYVYDNLKDWGLDPELSGLWDYAQQRVINVGFKLTF